MIGSSLIPSGSFSGTELAERSLDINLGHSSCCSHPVQARQPVLKSKGKVPRFGVTLTSVADSSSKRVTI